MIHKVQSRKQPYLYFYSLCLPCKLQCWQAKAYSSYGWCIGRGAVYWAQSRRIQRIIEYEISHGTRYSHRLERHGKNLAIYILERTTTNILRGGTSLIIICNTTEVVDTQLCSPRTYFKDTTVLFHYLFVGPYDVLADAKICKTFL